MSEDGVAAILRRLDAIDRRLNSIEADHMEDMTALGVRLDLMTAAHDRCSSHCWVRNESQIRDAIKTASSGPLKDGTWPPLIR